MEQNIQDTVNLTYKDRARNPDTSMMQLFVTITNASQSVFITAKSYILNVAGFWIRLS